MDEQFFEKLVDFLPKHVSPMPSYIHGTIAFVVSVIVTYTLGNKYFVFDFNGDGETSEIEEKTQTSVKLAVSLIISLLVADLVFSSSWRLRNFTINKNHMIYKRWFPNIY